ncbi:DUF3413 domain-containing protein [Vibrio vulnificus]|uniref:DUF3413 domain-containing protein n=1 Tax=Vibrio vulnificus TaxID=672 RepID=UPI000304889B|nr:DUF3413 domain-containing protein [Vibrio vulnificus]ASM96140.1 choline-sulfatase [Vibrio vulnificus NBRC 15645 = ATCC 27562]ELF6473615.1 DUF3413 domain-containing protein [Vibrio vulnificus]MCL7019295.1 DUF3413 domain-containing protein [Vibrio vulnificus]MDK2700803.1 DUF3413 domain-containing protein [Vibrio vulnificus]QET75130.1 DUF3413 domain-containing protein [Vibrio vulnificus]
MSFKQKLHAHGWFILINALVLMLIASRYFAFLPEFPTDPLGITFILAGTWGQMTLLAAIIGLVTIPTLFLPKPFRNGTQALIASLGVATLFIDTIVFAQYRFHINAVVLELVMSGQIVSFPLITWLMVIGGVALLLAAQWWTIRWLENGAPVRALKLGRKFALLTFAALLATNAIHIWAAAHAYQPVTTVKRYLPLFYPATADKFMRKQGWVDEEALERQKALAFKRKNDLNYPLASLQTQPVEKPLNIMLLVVDSWRADTFNSDNTPNMWKYAQSGVVFNNHIATGNATRTGIFGLFYGIPGTYWHGFLANQQSPVLIDRLQALDYQLGIFTAAQLRKPEFNQTVFTKVENLRIGSEGSRPSELDADLTQDWLAWYDQRDKSKPTFSFLFYDAPHGYDFPADFEPKYEPMLKEVNYLKLNNDTDPTPFFNRYKTSVRYVDSMATKVLDKLKESGDLENTLVIITGDHGQEMNDNKLNFWGHNSNFTDAQVNVPFAIFGPGVDAAKMQWSSEALTSHQDVVPTLMKHYLGVTNDVKDYSVGEDLLGDAVKRDWIISSNYSGYAIITDDNILEVSGGGQYQFMDKTNRQLKEQQPNFTYLQQALEQISRFSK